MPETTIKDVLTLHARWLRCEGEGRRANLSDAYLLYANLSGADLQETATGGA